MEPKPGSFMAPAGGGGSPLMKLLQMRGQGAGGALNQNTTSPNAALPSSSPSSGGISQGGGQSSPYLPKPISAPMPPMSMPPTASSAGMPPMGGTDMEKQIILKALEGRLKAISKVEEIQATGGL